MNDNIRQTENPFGFEQADWIFFTDLNWGDESIMQYHVDTRDFCVYTDTKPKDIVMPPGSAKKPEKYFHTKDEILTLLAKLYNDSGGNVKWRMLRLTGEAKHQSDNWQMKYLRIYRTKKGLVVTTGRNEHSNIWIWSKQMLAYPVAKRHLNAH